MSSAPAHSSPAVPSHWQAAHVAALASSSRAAHTIAPFAPASLAPALPGFDLWDLWPLQLADGSTALFEGWSVWFVLSAPAPAGPACPDPDARHDIARIRLMAHKDGVWRDGGNALPDGHNPGSREWAGSALYAPETGTATLYYTVAGFPGEARRSFAQRLFETHGQFTFANGLPQITGWSTPHEFLVSDGHDYMLVNQGQGVPGFIKGFRDPAHFQDPADGARYMVFTGSLGQSDHAFNGCIGIARAAADGSWQLLPPLVSADGLNNEMERPILLHREGAYYLFWSTQAKVFAPDGPAGPNGIYGMVAPSVLGPWAPLNGHSLVAGNPDSAPYQAYSWWVDADLAVWGFADLPGVAPGGQVDDPAWRRAHFAGTFAPVFHLALAGASARVAQPVQA